MGLNICSLLVVGKFFWGTKSAVVELIGLCFKALAGIDPQLDVELDLELFLANVRKVLWNWILFLRIWVKKM